MQQPTDAILVGRARSGDAEAWETLIRRHLRPAYALALSRVGQPADADDVVQDAFVSALGKIEDCRKPDQFGSWLLSIVRNKAYDYLRYKGVRDAKPLEFAEETVAGNDSPEGDTERAELRARLLDAMQGLTELQRDVILLYDFEGWNHKEIAEKLDITEGSARVHLHNARKSLRERLSDLQGE